jgi:hypothetical protein
MANNELVTVCAGDLIADYLADMDDCMCEELGFKCRWCGIREMYAGLLVYLNYLETTLKWDKNCLEFLAGRPKWLKSFSDSSTQCRHLNVEEVVGRIAHCLECGKIFRDEEVK